MRPDDTVDLLPQSDGGPGFVAVLAAAGAVAVRTAQVSGPLGEPVDADYGVSDDGVVYIEAAQACGLPLLGGPPTTATALAASTAGVGELIRVALDDGARRIVVGLGGSATTDGGRGALDALGGARAAADLLRDIDVVVASDVDNPLLGPDGAAAVFGPQKGADGQAVVLLEARLAAWADDLADACPDTRDVPGAGAAGGLGVALFAVGGRRRAGTDVVAEATGRRARLTAADVILTGEGRFDAQTARGKVIAALAADAGDVPVLVLAGQIRGEPTIDGVAGAWSVTEHAGSVEAAMAEAGPSLFALASDVARIWTDRRGGLLRE
ncbi:glycerate kinase [Gordonia humi]|uniref:glycerate kinase family protein n=1 Tax=Gordonia humi TaxID=686429 RepID=UPI0036123AA3